MLDIVVLLVVCAGGLVVFWFRFCAGGVIDSGLLVSWFWLRFGCFVWFALLVGVCDFVGSLLIFDEVGFGMCWGCYLSWFWYMICVVICRVVGGFVSVGCFRFWVCG